MMESQRQGASAKSERVTADIQDQKKLVCVEVPGRWLIWLQHEQIDLHV